MHQYFAYGSTTLLLFSFQLAIKPLEKHEVGYDALHRAGYTRETLAGRKVGVLRVGMMHFTVLVT